MTAAAGRAGVYLRPLEESDFTDTYLSWFTDPEVTRFLEARNISHPDAVEHLREGRRGDHCWFLYAICASDSQRHVGNIKIGPIQWRNYVADLVTVIGDREAWGKGYGRDAIRLGMQLAFEEHGLRKLSASIDSRNIGSIKAYTAAGFEVEASLKDHFMDASAGVPVLSDKIYVAAFKPTPGAGGTAG